MISKAFLFLNLSAMLLATPCLFSMDQVDLDEEIAQTIQEPVLDNEIPASDDDAKVQKLD